MAPEERMIRCLREGSHAAGVKVSERGHLTAGANEIARWRFGGLRGALVFYALGQKEFSERQSDR